MKKWFFIALLLSCFCGYGNEPCRLTAKAILKNTNGYFVLSDASCWKVVGFQKRTRSLSEWWNGVQLVPENYECLPNDWYLGSQVEIYPKYENLEVNEADASNQADLIACTHLLLNPRTGHILFAIALEPEECLVELYNDAYTDGYEKGYSTGWSDGYNSGYQAKRCPNP